MNCQAALLTLTGCVGYRVRSCDKMPLVKESLVVNQEKVGSSEHRVNRDFSILEDLINRSQEGDPQAMETLYERYKRPLFSLIYRHTYNFEAAEDLLQDVFIKIFSHIKDIQNVDTFKAWSYRIALNSCYSYLRSRRSASGKTVPLEEVEGLIRSNHDVEQRAMRKPLDNAIESLPHRLKSVFLLHDVQGFKHEEISQMLGCSVGTSKSQLFKARMRIRAYLKDKQAL